jgi:hypothetical protein
MCSIGSKAKGRYTGRLAADSSTILGQNQELVKLKEGISFCAGKTESTLASERNSQ